MKQKQIELLSKEVAKKITDTLPTAIYITDAEGCLRHLNSAAVEISGWKPELDSDRWCIFEKLYYPDGTLMPPEESPLAIALKEERNIKDAEILAECPDGDRVWLQAYATPLYNENGELIGGINMLIDVSDQKEIEAELRDAAVEAEQLKQDLQQNEEKYRTLFETMDEGFCIIKMKYDDNNEPVNFYYLKTNSAYHRHSGIRDTDIEGKAAKEVMPNIGEHMLKRNGKVALTGEPFHDEIYVDEIDRWLDLSAFRMGKPEERKVAVLFKNITERKKNELNKAYLSSIIENSDDAIISKDLNGIITSWNDSAERIFGYSAEEVTGQSITIIIPDERIDEEKKILNQIRNGERVDHFETIRERKDGTKLNISLNISPIKNSEGAIVGASKIARDITEHKQTRKKLQEMNETLEERVEKRTASLLSYQNKLRSLAAKLSKAEEKERQRLASELHDNLGQLLAVAKIKIDLLEKEEPSGQIPSRIEDLKEVMEEALSYTSDLVTELKPPPSLNEKDLLAKIEWVAKKMRKYDLRVVIQDDDLPKPLSNEVQITLLQCVRELLFNIVKHTSVNEAYVSLERNQQIEITVEDKGEGFNTENISAPTDKGGFGLFNIRERIDMLGGKVKIESEPENGTKAHIYVPFKNSDTEEYIPLESSAKSNGHKNPTMHKNSEKIKIVLADDHQMVREGLRNIIEEEDDMIVIGEAADGKETVKISHERSPDVILMDVKMPKMDGIEATKKVTSEMPHIRVIGLSLHDDEGVARDMRKVGATAYLTKNEAFKSLASSIRAEASALKNN